MTYDDAVKALSNDAVKLVKNNQTIGLGSGRSATAFVKSLSLLVKKKKINIKFVLEVFNQLQGQMIHFSNHFQFVIDYLVTLS